MLKLKIAAIAAATALAGCSSEEASLPEESVKLGYTFDFATLDVAMDDAGVNPLFRKVNLAWSDLVFDPEYCDYKEELCSKPLLSVDLCAESPTAENSCDLVSAGVKNDGSPVSLANLTLAANQELFLLANYEHGSYPSNKIGFTSEQYDSFVRSYGRGDADNYQYTYYGEAIAISSDGSTIVAGDHLRKKTVDPIAGSDFRIFELNGEEYELQLTFEQPDTSYSQSLGEVVAVNDNGNVVVALSATDESCSTDIATPDRLCSSRGERGAVYVAETDGVSPRQVTMFKPNKDPVSEDLIELGVSGDGTVIFVGSRLDNVSQVRVSSYVKNAGGEWGLEHSLAVDLPYSSKIAGMDVSRDGSTVVMSEGQDMILVFSRNESGFTNTQQLLNPFGTEIEDASGLSISGDGNTIVAGYPSLEYGYDEGAQGGYAIYKRADSGQFELLQKGYPEYLDQNSEFGDSIAVNYDGSSVFISAGKSRWNNSDGAVVIGEPSLNWRHDGDVGSVSLYSEQADGSYKHTSLMTPPSSISYDSGMAEGENTLAVSDGGVVVVGAPLYLDNTTLGGMFVY